MMDSTQVLRGASTYTLSTFARSRRIWLAHLPMMMHGFDFASSLMIHA